MTSLDRLPSDEFAVRKRPRPAGYAAQTRLFFGGLAVPALLDWGATCSAIPEEVVCVLLEYTLELVNSEKIKSDSELYPITRIEKYTSPTSLGGVASAAQRPWRRGTELFSERSSFPSLKKRQLSRLGARRTRFGICTSRCSRRAAAPCRDA